MYAYGKITYSYNKIPIDSEFLMGNLGAGWKKLHTQFISKWVA